MLHSQTEDATFDSLKGKVNVFGSDLVTNGRAGAGPVQA